LCRAELDAEFERFSQAEVDRERRQVSSEQRKRKREESKAEARTALAAAATAHPTGATGEVLALSTEAAALAAWSQALGTRCKLPQLRALCLANSTITSGTKAELVLRLTRFKAHGGPGVCPLCSHPRLHFVYGAADQDILALPRRVECTHVRYPSLHRCTYNVDYAAMGSIHANPLKDDADGDLARFGLGVPASASAAAALSAPGCSASNDPHCFPNRSSLDGDL
jgi:hypothetical protein